uniref:Uncharacterized protein n=1 Tax=Anas zonorhyncha TaxID=75864 RepID=A0A8B9ZYV1_9AVES
AACRGFTAWACSGTESRRSRTCAASPTCDELPRSLRLLDLTGNACTRQPGYRELVVGALPHLLQLDARPLRGCTDPAPGEEEEEEEEEEGSPSSEDDDEELFSEPGAPFTADKDFFADLHQELAGRSRRRRGEALEEHRSRLQDPPGPPAMSGQGRARPGAELSGLQGVHSLGLQRNRIEKIENLCCFPNLRSLSLAGNRIRRVQNLRPLQQLRSLDLSQNLIRALDPDELPRSLQLLDLTGNACTRQPGYRWVGGTWWR